MVMDIDALPPSEEIFGYHTYDQVVVFADMLGFSALTMRHALEPETFEEMSRPSALEFMRASLEDMEANPLVERFIRFHFIVEQAVRDAKRTADVTSLTFSDCAFFATRKLPNAVSYAKGLMRRALEHRIAVRMGIGCGEFLIVRIRADFGTKNQDHVVQFLGSGVSRAHAAEHCGIKGMRIFLHPSVDELLSGKWHYRDHSLGKTSYLIGLPLEERENRAGVNREVNYLWHAKHDERYVSAVREMRKSSEAKEHVHYAATLDALNRMRLAHGRPPLESEPVDA